VPPRTSCHVNGRRRRGARSPRGDRAAWSAGTARARARRAPSAPGRLSRRWRSRA
jgi:hypothetical protein